MRIEITVPAGTETNDATLALLREACDGLGIKDDIMVSTDSAEAGVAPIVRIDGRDMWDAAPSHDRAAAESIPPKWLVESALLRALKPKNIVFMCVQNSARSQLAEAIARHIAPKNMVLQSAGSEPYMVRPQVPRILAEEGIDPSGLYAKSLDDLNIDAVDAVVTLCAEEVCPMFPRPVYRLHWAMEDPAKGADEEAKLQSFRRIRDELMLRLTHLLNYSS